jgi:hypothetical protein
VIVLNCSSATNAELVNDDFPNSTVFGNGGYGSRSWGEFNSPFATVSSGTYQIGTGTGANAVTTTFTINAAVDGSQCVFQVTAEQVAAS